MDKFRPVLSGILGLLWRVVLFGMFLMTLTFFLTSRQLFNGPGKLAYVLLAALGGIFLFLPGCLWRRCPPLLRKGRVLLLILMTLLSLPVPLCAAGYHSLTELSYLPVDSGFFTGPFCIGRRALVIAPHQDDEANMAAPMIEALTDAGSEVYVAYFTCGDYFDLADLRQQEAAQAMAVAGVPRDHLIFLGYGDGWQGAHLYNCPPNQVVTSQNNRTCTYGSEEFPDFATLYRGAPSPYTRANALQDMKDCLLYVRPDVIFCADYDAHTDHRATSLLFEEALGQLLAEEPDWKPQVFKSLSYLTSWDAPSDFYTVPLAQTLEPGDLGTPSYRWEDRVRFPVPSRFLTYSIARCEYRRIYRCYDSQAAIYRANNATNSDLVFFERNTDSLLYGARLTASSGDPSVVTDFKLIDTSRIASDTWDLGIWSPTDSEKTLRCEFPEPVSLNTVSLWDDPDPGRNVLAGQLLLSDGTRIDIPALDPLGTENEISFDLREDIRWAQLQLTETQGQAGITELELARREPRPTAFIKLMDASGNFLYNAPADPGQTLELSLYCWPENPHTFTVTVARENGQILETMEGLTAGSIPVSLPGKGRYRVTAVCTEDPTLMDSCILDTAPSPGKALLLRHFEEDYLLFLHYSEILLHRYLGFLR